MEKTTLIVLLAVALVVMAVVVCALVVRLIHKNNELKEKNDVIVREVRRNQTLIDRAVQQGVSRAAMLSVSLLLLGSVSVLTSCSKDDETIYTPDPTDAPRTSPLVTVVYSPDALGDKSYNDLIYSGVEGVSTQKELRTLHLSPATKEEGLAYLEDIFRQMETPGDTVRRLLIVASSDYDTWLRQNNKRLEGNPRADLLYFETSKPLDGKGSTFYMPYYGAMYMAGAIAPFFQPKALLIGANPEDEVVSEAMQGFKDGFATEWVATAKEKHLTTMYIGQHAGEGYSIADTLALKMMHEYNEQDEFGLGTSTAIIPICGGASTVFMRLSAVLGQFIVMGIDVMSRASNSQYSVVKRIDMGISESIRQWLDGEGIPKHQILGLASGCTSLYLNTHNYWFVPSESRGEPSEELLWQIHEEAIKKEEEYGK
ncbi:MAG: hypothetical protein IKH91_12915 [Prevotella sp.]|nr:hypothetical protein [Prevotella sp.]